jgi:hypothetical protein
MWCITEITNEYRKRMYRLLALYNKPYNPAYPVVCFDEKSKQLLEDSRTPIPMKPGSVRKYDYEYRRHGTCNIFVAVEPKAGKHHIKVTDTRTKKDFAQFMKWLIDKKYRKVKKIMMVLDNLNTHFIQSFYEAFSVEECARLLKKIKFIYTPKHASWLNMAEIEINLLDHECLGRNIGNRYELETQVGAWCNQNNIDRRKIFWSFTKYKADKKLSKYYVS